MVLNLKNLNSWGINGASYLKLWYPMRVGGTGTEVDLSPAAHNGTWVGNATVGKNKDGSNCAVLNNGDYITVTHSDLNFTTGTILFWVKATDSWGSSPGLIWSGTTGTAGYIQYSSGIKYYPDGSAGYAFITSPENNTWYFISLVGNGSYAILYCNGVYVTQVSRSTALFTNTSMQIGGTSTYSSNCLVGSMKDVMFFNGIALTEGQIRAIYDATYIA